MERKPTAISSIDAADNFLVDPVIDRARAGWIDGQGVPLSRRASASGTASVVLCLRCVATALNLSACDARGDEGPILDRWQTVRSSILPARNGRPGTHH